MKLIAAILCAASFGGALLYRPQVGGTVRLIVLGNHQGNLSPCGCSSPMLGGILREAAKVREIQKGGQSVVIDSGNMSKEDSVQERLKAQTLSETLAGLGTVAVNLGFTDSELGTAELAGIQRLLKGALTTDSVRSPAGLSLESFKEADQFLIGGVSMNSTNLAKKLGGQEIPRDQAIQDLTNQASSKSLMTVLMVDGDKGDAIKIAQNHPSLDVIVYNSTAEPPLVPLKEGKTFLVSPGERGEYLLSLDYPGEGSPIYRTYKLGEDVKDDPQASRFYSRYLSRIEEHHLWEDYPRYEGKKWFAGSASCAKCHQADYQIWKGSQHAHAFSTIANRGHAQDPECIVCHVTGGAFKEGFRSLQSTPKLAFVGCESCHGAAADHARKPYLFHLPKVEPKTCISCHGLLNSPRFSFDTYWPKIRHGTVEKGWKPHS